ncbi:MAG: xanthine dehydrogenase family protein [Alphaproteobacteria bacterium]|nr:xanthine dehydrogenase family protein [Alphaproteobacteria bacterium]
MAGKFGRAQAIARVEDRRLLTGSATFSDDLAVAGALHMALLRSPHAHARIRAIDPEKARRAKGVVAVVTGADLVDDGVGPISFQQVARAPDGGRMRAPPRLVLAQDVVRFVGEPVAAVVATSRFAAEDALDRIVADYEPLPCVADLRAAVADGAPLVWHETPRNIVGTVSFGEPAAAEQAFAAAAHVVSIALVNQRLVPAALEPRAALAEWDATAGRLTLTTPTQNATTVRRFLAEEILRLPLDKVRVRVREIGGGFGMKCHLYPEDALLAVLARKLGRPVRWRAARADDFLAGTHGRDHATDAALALDGAGRILALRVRTLANLGAYLTPPGAAIPLVLHPRVTGSVYAIPALDLRVDAVLTHTMSVHPYRGAGRPEANYVMERLLDAAARQLGRDPAALRRLNLVPPAQMPYRTAVGETIECGNFPRMLDQAVERADGAGFEKRRRAAKRRGMLLGRGIASYVEWTGANQLAEAVSLIAGADGTVTLHSATQAMGQGLETSYVQILADRLGIAPERIRVLQGDTDIAQGFGSMASRSLFVGGSAVAEGAGVLVDRLRALAGEALEADTTDIAYRHGVLSVAGTDRRVEIADLARRQKEQRIVVDHRAVVGAAAWPNGCHACEVEVDPETGRVRLVRYVGVDDVGRVVHPAIVEGQVHGGIAQGVGQALLEQCVYDRDGQLLTGSFMDYAMPRASDLPSYAVTTDDSAPSPSNPLGAKGAGESGTISSSAAVMNAVLDALAPLGVDRLDMPATPLRVWEAIEKARRTGR